MGQIRYSAAGMRREVGCPVFHASRFVYGCGCLPAVRGLCDSTTFFEYI